MRVKPLPERFFKTLTSSNADLNQNSIRRLCADMILQSLNDLIHSEYRRQAKHWFNDKHDTILTYRWCLSNTELNPSVIRRGIEILSKMELGEEVRLKSIWTKDIKEKIQQLMENTDTGT